VGTWRQNIYYTIKFERHFIKVLAVIIPEDSVVWRWVLSAQPPTVGGFFGNRPKFGAPSNFIGTSGGLPVLTGVFLGIWSAGVNGHNFG